MLAKLQSLCAAYLHLSTRRCLLPYGRQLRQRMTTHGQLMKLRNWITLSGQCKSLPVVLFSLSLVYFNLERQRQGLSDFQQTLNICPSLCHHSWRFGPLKICLYHGRRWAAAIVLLTSDELRLSFAMSSAMVTIRPRRAKISTIYHNHVLHSIAIGMATWYSAVYEAPGPNLYCKMPCHPVDHPDHPIRHEWPRFAREVLFETTSPPGSAC